MRAWALIAVTALAAVALVLIAGLATAGEPAPARGGDANGSVSSPVMPFDPGYWTPERMASAKPMPMPTPG